MRFLTKEILKRSPWLIALLLVGSAFGQDGALRVTDPRPANDGTVITDQPAIWLKGTLDWAGGDQRVLWKSNRGFSDLATVAASADPRILEWSSTAPIPLRPGVNHVRIRALGQPGAATSVNIFYDAPAPPSTPPQGATILGGQQLRYEVIGDNAVYQGDLILGKAGDVEAGRFAGRFAAGGVRQAHPQAATIATNPATQSGLWPVVSGVVRVPYTMTSVNTANINAAVAESNTQLPGKIQWVPATGGDVNFVRFNFNSGDQSGTCESNVGMQLQGGEQDVTGAGNCTVGTILHEMGHTLGLYHEQSRADRNNYVSYSESNVDKPLASNFDLFASGVDSGLFNYASLMEYDAFLFSRYGVAPVLETIPAGIVLSTEMPQYTTGDLDGILRLYGFAPAAVTVDSNPTGLQLVVDGSTCTAPCVFTTWTLGSKHTLAVPLDSHAQTVQTLSQQPYIFGNWNTAPSPTTSQSITITNSQGDGTLLSPGTAPAVTNYLASFIPVHPYNPQVYPSGAGTISPSPAPNTLILNGASTKYFTDRQNVILSVTANSGYSFFVWNNVSLPNYYARPLNFYITSNFDFQNFNASRPVQAFFVNDAVTTVSASSPDNVGGLSSPGFLIGVIETSKGGATTFGYTPVNFDASQNGSGFAAGAHLTLCASGFDGVTCPASAVAVSPVTTNLSYLFGAWSGTSAGNSNALAVTVPAGGGQFTATYTPSFRTIVLPSLYCGGISVTSSPVGTNSVGTNGNLDTFLNSGTVTFTANAGTSGLNFVGWSQDLSGAANPYAYALSTQVIGTANFNVPGTTAPLAVTSVSPAAPTVGTATNLVVTGTGFSTNSNVTQVYIGPQYGQLFQYPTTLQSATQLTVQLPAGALPAAAYYQILIENSGSACGPSTSFTFPAANTVTPILQTITVTPATPSIAKGLTQSFTATGRYSDGSTKDVTAQTAWASDTLSVATMSGAVATAVGVGTANISATLGAVKGSAVLTVTAAALQSIAVAPANPSIAKGLTQSFTATGTYSDTSTKDLTTQAAWASDTLSVATISGAVATAVGVGTANISATVGAVKGSTLLTVTAAALQSIAVAPANPSIAKGLTQSFTATGTYSDSSTKDLTAQAAWTSDTLSVATMGGAVATAVGVGTANISATLGAVKGSTALTVTATVLQSIAVTPANPSIAKGLTQSFTATGKYSDNSTKDLTAQAVWASDTLSTATMSGAVATAVGVGTANISATLGGVKGSTLLTVTPVALQSIAVAPANPSIAKGLTQSFTATGIYSDSSTKDVTAQAAWTSDTLSVATMNGATATGAGVGTANISATLGAVKGSTVLTVTAATLVSIAVTPTNPTIVVGLQQQFTATGTYTDGSTKDLTGLATWASATPAAATISNAGLATASGLGSSSISATLGGVKGSTLLTVTALGPCDVKTDGIYGVADVQKMINETLGGLPPLHDLNGDQVVNAIDVQIVINAALRLGCTL